MKRRTCHPALTSDNVQNKRCQVCDAPATESSFDVIEIPAPDGDRFRHFKLSTNVSYGCKLHPVIGRCFNLDGSICLTVPRGYKKHVHHGSSLLVRRNA